MLDTTRSPVDVRCSLGIHSDFMWKVYVYGKEVSQSMSSLLASNSVTLHKVTAVKAHKGS